MQPASEKCSYLEELSCKEDSLKANRFCFNQNQDTLFLLELKYHLAAQSGKFKENSCVWLKHRNIREEWCIQIKEG